MKLVIITQKVDIYDNNLGFFHGWLEKFSKRLDKVYVVCLWMGEYKLPKNVEVFSMGKERGFSKLFQFLNLQMRLFRTLKDADGVFVHMSPIYAISSFLIAKLFRKKMLMWYVHKSRNFRLWLAEKLVDKIYTASEESFAIKSKKVEVVGHGIDVDRFFPKERNREGKFKILFVGRISPIKDLGTLLDAAGILAKELGRDNFQIELVGDAVDDSERKYFESIKKIVEERELSDCVLFSGGLKHKEMPEKYNESDVLVNLSPTGGMDKAVLEAMASGVPVLAANKTFKPLLERANYDFIFEFGNAADLAQKIEEFKKMSAEERKRVGLKLRDIVENSHNLDNLINRIIEYFKLQNGV